MNLLRKFRCRLGTAALILAMMSAGCAGVDPQVYRDKTPRFNVETFFSGRLDAVGMFQDRSGKVIRRFTVVLDAQWQGDTGRLSEDFRYDDGEKQRRVWTLQRIDETHWRGMADDLVGEARGVSAGNVLSWRYRIRLPVGETSYEVDFDDTMVLIDSKTMLNRAIVSKFGLRVGEVFISFRKP